MLVQTVDWLSNPKLSMNVCAKHWLTMKSTFAAGEISITLNVACGFCTPIGIANSEIIVVEAHQLKVVGKIISFLYCEIWIRNYWRTESYLWSPEYGSARWSDACINNTLQQALEDCEGSEVAKITPKHLLYYLSHRLFNMEYSKHSTISSFSGIFTLPHSGHPTHSNVINHMPLFAINKLVSIDP